MTVAPKEDSRLKQKSPSPTPASWHRGQGAIPEGVLNRHPVGGDCAGSPALLAVMLLVPGKCVVPTEPSQTPAQPCSAPRFTGHSLVRVLRSSPLRETGRVPAPSKDLLWARHLTILSL